MLNHVHQEESGGCMIACLAMLTGHTYQQVRADFPDRIFIKDVAGGSLTEAVEYLRERGAVATSFTHPNGSTMIAHAYGGGHQVVIAGDQIYDPDEVCSISLAANQDRMKMCCFYAIKFPKEVS